MDLNQASNKVELSPRDNYVNEVIQLREHKRKEAELLLNKHRKNWNITLFFGVLAATLFSTSISYKLPYELIRPIGILEFVCFTIALVLFIRMEGKHLKELRIKARRDSEAMRSLEAFTKGGIRLQPLDSILIEPQYNSDEVVSCIAKGEGVNAPHLLPFDKEAQSKVLLDLLVSQKEYHEKRWREMKLKKTILDTIQFILLGILIVLGIFQFINLLFFNLGWLSASTAQFLTLSIPIAIGAIEAFIYFRDVRRNVLESEHMKKYFSRKIDRVKNVKNKEEFELISHEVRTKMDEENLDWCISTQANANGKI